MCEFNIPSLFLKNHKLVAIKVKFARRTALLQVLNLHFFFDTDLFVTFSCLVLKRLVGVSFFIQDWIQMFSHLQADFG